MTSIIQSRWQEIAFLMMAGWMGWLSLMVFSQQGDIRMIQMQLAIRNGADLRDIQAQVDRLKAK